MGIRRICHRGQSLLVIAAAVAGLCGIPLRAQSTEAAAPLEFDVASVKPTVDRTLPGLITRPPGSRSYHGVNMPLMSYLTIAYQVRAAQINGPDWLSTEFFDMEAKADRTCTVDELHVMLQNLLLERFHIKLHRESKDQPAYALVVDKGGPKLTDHDPADKVTLPIPGMFGKINGSNVTMTYFAFYLSNILDQTVVDRTELDGHYDFKAEWGFEGIPAIGVQMAMPPPPPPGASGTVTPAEMPVSALSNLSNLPSIFDALKHQLGLRLDPVKIPVERLVIDHIEKLTEN